LYLFLLLLVLNVIIIIITTTTIFINIITTTTTTTITIPCTEFIPKWMKNLENTTKLYFATLTCSTAVCGHLLTKLHPK
jgi:hypothetical protein